jgi:hypothetical protein
MRDRREREERLNTEHYLTGRKPTNVQIGIKIWYNKKIK